MGHSENFENLSLASKIAERPPLLGDLLVNAQSNRILQKSSALSELPAILPSAQELLKQLSNDPLKDFIKQITESLTGPDSKPHKQDVSIIGGGIADAVQKALSDMTDKREARQHQIAEREAKDPNVQKVTERHDGPIATVIVERRDGSVTTYKPDGLKITEKAGTKITEFPPEYNHIFGVTKVTEYPNGSTETRYKNGSVVIVPKEGDAIKTDPDGTRTTIKGDGTQIITKPGDGTRVVIRPDHTKITQKPDGTEIVESPNHDRVITKPERIREDGTKIWHKDDGTEIREKLDGTRITVFPEKISEKVEAIVVKPNGDTTTVMRDFTAITVKKDGTIVHTGNDGTAVAIHPNGSIETKSADGKKEIRELDGTTYTKYPDGRSELKFKDGSSLTKYPDGHMEKQLVNVTPKTMMDMLQPKTQQAETLVAAAILAIKENTGFSV